MVTSRAFAREGRPTPTSSGRFHRPVSGVDDGLVQRAVGRAREGDRDALRYLYLCYAEDVRRYVQTIVRDPHEAEDVTQDVFAKLVIALTKYEPRGVAFSAWMLRVARNVALDHIRAAREVPCEEIRGGEVVNEEAGFERSQALRTALTQLPQDQRAVLMLRHLAGLNPREIAERLDRSEASIHGLHHRGRQALRVALTDLGSGPVTATS